MNGQEPRVGTSPLVVEIGLKEIYDLLVATNTNVQLLGADVKDLITKADDHEARLRALERGRWPLPALAAVMSIAALILTALQHIR